MKNCKSIFLKNCNIWAQTDPQKAVLLPYVDKAHLNFCQTALHEENLIIRIHDKEYFFYPQTGAAKSADNWFSSLDLNNTTVLFVYGVGLGYYYVAAKKWLGEDEKRRLVFLEDNLSVVSRLFETNLGSEILKDSQVQLYYFENAEKSKELFNQLYWNFFLTPLQVSALEMYESLKRSQTEMLKHKIQYDASIKNGLLIEYLEYGVGYFKNFYPNILCLEGAYLADDLFGNFKNIPAIICGAGPSLEKNISTLGKITDKALIFAGGSALNVLNSFDIQPHFGAAIDPNAPQYDRMSSNTAFEVPFFYRNRLFHEAFKTIRGQRLYVRGGGGYDTSRWFEEGLDIAGESIEEGHNVVNFCLEIAHALGCNPIIFVGMDLAYTDMKAYAPGVVKDSHVEAEEITKVHQFDQAAIEKKDIFGKPVYTLWKWIAEADWIGEFAKTHPEITVINATEGGLGFPDVPNMSLKDVAEQHLKNEYDLIGMVHAEILKTSLPSITNDKILVLLKQLLESLERCIEDFNILIEESEVMKKRIKREKKVPFPQQTGRASLYESDLADEIGYQYVLHMFNEAYSRVLNRELQTGKRFSEVKKALNKMDLLIKRFGFLRDVTSVNIELIKLALKNHTKCSSFSLPRVNSINHKKSGTESLYYENKQLLSKVTPDRATLYYSNGNLYSEQVFKDKKWHGPQKFYNPNGTLKTILEYDCGKFISIKRFE